MDAYESDNHAYAHMRKNGIHRQKKSGPRKGQWVHETVGGKPFHPRKMDERLKRIYGGKAVPAEAKARALKAKMGKKTRSAVEKM